MTPLGRRIPGRDYGQGVRLLHRLVEGDSLDTLRIRTWTRLELDEFVILWEQCEEFGLKSSGVCPSGVKLLVFLHIITSDVSYLMVRELFQYSPRTITRIFHEVLRILSGPFYRAMVKPSTAEVQDKVRSNKRFFPYFRNCVGAVDGTHIPIAVSHQNDAHVPWRNRKGHVTQNVLGVVDFDLNFRYVLAGWEGSAHDSLVIRNAVERGFRAPEQGKYYLGDAGYTSLDGLLLVPYQKVRYHLREWRASGLRPETPEELFNHRHSCCRNAVERGFGVLKRRFAILRNSTGRQGFSIKTQVRIVYACVALHNFINKYYDVMKEADEMEREAERSGQGGMHMNVDERTMPEEPDERRELIKRDMWRDYRRNLR